MSATAERATAGSAVGVGHGSAPGHHGEILQGIFSDGGRATPGLVTLPMWLPGAEAVFRVEQVGNGVGVSVEPAGRTRAQRAVTSLLRHLCDAHGLPEVRGHLRLRGRLPIGLGLGSSSADVMAAMQAAADAIGVDPDAVAMCRVAAEVEGACDPLPHLPQAVLFAQREGRVLEDFGATLPPLLFVSCETGGGRPIDTESCAHPEASDVPTYDELRSALRRALAQGDINEVGNVATASAELNQRRLTKDELPALLRASRRCNAVGVQVAHSGNVAGVLFCGRSRGALDRARRCASVLEDDGVRVGGVHRPPESD